jgi:hypothetical protein
MSDSLHDALRLLKDDNLVWSDDFESIRKHLVQLLVLIDQSGSHLFDEPVDGIIAALSSPELTVPEPLEKWVMDSSRTLGVYSQVAGKSKQTADAIRKLFGII